MPLGAKTITLELAARFLKDYLEGDLYFKASYPGHNLVRTRAQLKLVEDMESKYNMPKDEIQALIKQFLQF